MHLSLESIGTLTLSNPRSLARISYVMDHMAALEAKTTKIVWDRPVRDQGEAARREARREERV